MHIHLKEVDMKKFIEILIWKGQVCLKDSSLKFHSCLFLPQGITIAPISLIWFSKRLCALGERSSPPAARRNSLPHRQLYHLSLLQGKPWHRQTNPLHHLLKIYSHRDSWKEEPRKLITLHTQTCLAHTGENSLQSPWRWFYTFWVTFFWGRWENFRLEEELAVSQ